MADTDNIDSARTMAALLVRLAEAGTEAQVKLRDFTPNPLGPGKIERIHGVPGAFKIVTAAIQHTPGQLGTQHKEVLLPFLFAAADVLWISEPPVAKDERISLSTGGS
jgi:hypothetical protein